MISTAASAAASFERWPWRPRIRCFKLQERRGILEHFDIVIGFQDQDVRGAHALDDQFGHVAEVGDEPQVAGGRAQQKTNRVLGIVRNGKSFHEQVVQFKAVAGLEQSPFEFGEKIGGGFFHAVKERLAPAVPPLFQGPGDGFLRVAVAINRDS